MHIIKPAVDVHNGSTPAVPAAPTLVARPGRAVDDRQALRGRGCTSHTRMTEQSLAHAQRPSRLSTAAPINGDTGRHRTRAPVTQPETEARGLAPTRNAKRPRRRRPRSSSPEDRISTTAREVETRPRVTRGKQTRGSAAPPFAASAAPYLPPGWQSGCCHRSRGADAKRSLSRLSGQGPKVLRWLLFEAANPLPGHRY
jgi:hypothetical protein